MSSLDRPKPKVSGGILEKCPKSSFEDDLWWHPLAGLFEAWGKGLLGRPCSICEIHTYPPLFIFLLHNHGIGQPFRVEHFFYSPSSLKLHYLISNCVRMILR